MSWTTTATPPARQTGPGWFDDPTPPADPVGGDWHALLERVGKLNGTGTLTGVLIQAYAARVAALSGQGQLAALLTQRYQLAVALSGSGTLEKGVDLATYRFVSFSGGGAFIPGAVGDKEPIDGLWTVLIPRYTIGGGGVAPLHLDDFNRPDTTAGLSSDWTNRAGVMGISGNAAYGVTSGIWNVASYNTPATTNDMEASITLGTPTGADYAMVGIGANAAGEMVFADNAAYDGHFHIYSVTDWGFGGLVDQANGGGGWVNGDVLKLKRVGSTYTVYLNGVSTGVTWNDSGNVVPRDSSHRLVSIGAYDDGSGSRRIDDFDASPIAGAAPGAPLFSGGGTLQGFVGSFSFANGDLNGSGALSAATKQIYPVAAPFSGDGALSGAVEAVASEAIDGAFSGVGGLSVFAGVAFQPKFAGSGALSAALREVYQKLAALTGDGALTATTAQIFARALGLSGDGALAALLMARYQRNANFSGDGALNAILSQKYSVTAPFSGGSALVCEAYNFALPDGLSGVVWARYLVPGIFASTGQLVAAVSSIQTVLAALIGSGALSAATPQQIYPLMAQMVGNGTLSASVMKSATLLADLLGSGTISATAFAQYLTSLGVSGAGALTAILFASYQAPAAAGGVGTVSATTMQIYTLTPQLSGGGALSATAVGFIVLTSPAPFSGVGTITALLSQIYTIGAPLSGGGTLSATATQVAIPTITNITTSPFRVGDTITLTGTGFVVGTSGAVTVTVGGVAATSVNVTSSTSLTCVVPSVAVGAQNVVVTAASGASSPYSITVALTPFNETNTARTNQTVPAGATGVWVTLLGAGGGGGLCGTGSNLQAHAGGGGAGGAAKVGRSFVGVASLGATYSVTRPLGAASNTAGAAAVFSSGSVVLTANGGGAGGNGSGNTAGTAGAGGTATQSGISGMTLVNGTAGAIGGTSGVTAVAAVNNTAGAGPGGGGGGGHNAAGSNFDGSKGGDSVNVTGGTAGQNGNNPGGAGTNGAAGQPGGGGGGGGGSSNGTANGSLGGKGGTYGAGGGGVGSGQFVGTGGAGGDSYTLLEWV